MVVQHNMQAMNANRQLNITTGAQGKSTEKLSSGYKINRSADDAAGLSISEKMRRQIRGLDRASTNAQDGISSVQTAEGALNEVHDMLQRMNELANQASNGTNSTTDRQAIQDEIDQLGTEIDRVAETTKFNEMYMLKGNPGTKTVNVKAHDAGLDGVLSDQGSTATFTAEFTTDSDIKISGNSYHIYDESTDKVDNFQSQIEDADSVMINGTTYTRMPKSGGSEAIEADPDLANQKLTSASALQGSASDLTTSASDLQTCVNNLQGSANTFVASAAEKTVCAMQKQASVTQKEQCASDASACAANKQGSADYFTDATKTKKASAKEYEDLASALRASAQELVATDADLANQKLTSASTLQGSASDLTTSASELQTCANNLQGSADVYTGSAADLTVCAMLIQASVKQLEQCASDISACAANKQGSADYFTDEKNIKQASADEYKALADTLRASAAILMTGADAVEGTAATKFSANDKEYTADELKAMIVDGAKVGINGTQARTAVDVVNNTSNKTIDDVKDMMQKALLQANQVGVDDETAVDVSEATQTGDRYSYTISKGTVEVAKDFSFNLHVGADADLTNKIGVNIEVMDTKNLGIHGLQVADDSGVLATYAIDAIEDAITKVNEQRSALGAVQNRLEHTINNLDNVVENTQSAESSIRDTDIADEMVRYSKNNILSQAGQSMLAQANQSTQGALSLLG